MNSLMRNFCIGADFNKNFVDIYPEHTPKDNKHTQKHVEHTYFLDKQSQNIAEHVCNCCEHS